MRGFRNFNVRGSNENGNFWSQTRGGPTLKKSRNYLFLGKIFKFQGGPDPRSPPLDPRMGTSKANSTVPDLTPQKGAFMFDTSKRGFYVC